MTRKLRIFIFLNFLLFSSTIFSQEPTEDDLPKFRKETKITEVIATDSAASAELLKRAVNWVKLESARYGKTNGISTGTKAECTVTFPVKPKELNPVCDYKGKIVMKITIETKDNKYKYTISGIKHVSETGRASAGSVDNVVPECGSLIMIDLTWRKLKGEALAKVASVVNEIKEAMKISSAESSKNEW